MEPESDGKRDVQLAGRRDRLARWLDTGFGPMAYEFDVTHSAQDVAQRWSSLETGGRTEDVVRVAGRLNLIRRHGGLDFGVLRDRTGIVQMFVDRAAVGADSSRASLLDRGDWIGVTGTVMRTDKGELSVARRGLRAARQGAAAAAGQGQGPRPTSRCATASATST